MVNTISLDVYNKLRSKAFLRQVQSNLVASKIAQIEFNVKDKVIENPVRGRASVTIGTPGTILEEVPVQDTNFNVETTTIDTPIYASEYLNTHDKHFSSDRDLEAEQLWAMNQAMLEAIDRFLITEIINQAQRTGPAIIDVVSANQSAREIVAKLTSIAGGKPSDYAFVVGTDLMQIFLEAGAQRVSEYGDNLLKTGELYDFYGLEVYSVNNDTDATLDGMGVQIPAGKYIALKKKAAHLYIDKNGIQFEKRPVAVNAGNVSLKDANVALVYAKVKIWSNNLPLVFKSA